MKSFTEFLAEARFFFMKGRDQDYIADPYTVLVFSEMSPMYYKLEGKTHGQMSHAIKHLREFDPSFVEGVINKVKGSIKTALKENPTMFCKLWISGKGYSKEQGLDALEKADTDIILNTLDVVNDKNQTKEPMTKIDSILKGHASEMESKYNELINKKLEKAVNIDELPFKGQNLIKKIKKTTVIKFDCFGRSNNALSVVLDFSDQSMIIGTSNTEGKINKVNTLYRLDNSGVSKGSILDAFFRKRMKIANPDVKFALENL